MRKFAKPFLIAALAVAAAWFTRSPKAASKAEGFEIPMQFIGTMPAVEVMVNGKGPFLFGIDTGGQGAARVDSSLMEKLGLQSSGQAQGTDGSGRGPQRMEMVRLASIEVGGLRFADVQAASRNYRTSPRMAQIDGVLTANLFSQYLLTLDYPAKQVRVSKGELPKPDGAEILDYKSDGGVPEVQLRFGEQAVSARLDSGNQIGGFVVPTALAEKLTFEGETKTVGRARSISGEMEIKEGRCQETVRFGRYEFPQPVITFPALGDSVNVGSKILSDFAITFDQKNGRLRLARKDGAAPPPQP